jgi:two-component system, NtrC family, nitrogen regulation response regulator NtrX
VRSPARRSDASGDSSSRTKAPSSWTIEAKEIERVGGGKPIPVDVRILAATNHDLERAVGDGRFREDLFFRLNVIPVTVPPLRERPDDIPQLVRHFSAVYRARSGRPAPSWSAEALELFVRYRWPGNVREHVGAVLQVDGNAASVPRGPLPDAAALEQPLSDLLDDYERTLITRALSVAGGNVAEAARRLKTDRPNLYRRMRRLNIGWGGG